MQTVNDFLTKRAEEFRQLGIHDHSEEMWQEVEQLKRRFGRSEPLVLVALYVMHDQYDRIPHVIEELHEEDLLAVARVLIEDLHGERLYDEGPYGGCRDSRYCRRAAAHCLDTLRQRIGHLLGARNDAEAWDMGEQAIQDRWGIIIDAQQASFEAELRALRHSYERELSLECELDFPDGETDLAKDRVIQQQGDSAAQRAAPSDRKENKE
jgi:hypothetical protein